MLDYSEGIKMSLIDDFMEIYADKYDYYQENVRICAKKCELELERNGIRAIVTNRAKRPDRLRLKLEKRIKGMEYKSIQNIYEDIADFAGIRIALYFPSDRDEVNKLIESNFLISKVEKFPTEDRKNNYLKRFSGYWATHYICALRKDKLYKNDLSHVNCMVEIQVASVLMHAWSEVEHDLVYKPLNGDLSEDEYELLDQLNGLVMSGEITLERLQKALKIRVAKSDKQFNNHYEFSAYIYDTIKKDNGRLISKQLLIVGRTDILFRFLQLSNLDRPRQISKFLANVDAEDTENRTIVEQIVDELLITYPELFKKYYIQAKYEVGDTNLYNDLHESERRKSVEHTIGFFITRWIVFESIIRKMYNKTNPINPMQASIFPYLKDMNYFDKNVISELQLIIGMKNRLVHEFEYPENIELINTGNVLIDIIKKLHSMVNDDLKTIIENELEGMKL